MNPWIWLTIAIVFEVAGTTALKMSEGFTKWLPSTLMVVFYIVTFWGLGEALKTLEVGVVYAIWAAIGVALISIIGIFFFGEGMNWVKAVSLVFIIAGVVGLHLNEKLAG